MITAHTAVRTLIVGCCEDDPAVARLLDDTFKTAGHAVRSVRTATEAVARFSEDADLDVIVLDVGLPDGDGRDACRALKANGQHAPVLFLSALGEVHEVVQGFAAGGLDWVVKPFAVPELLVRVEALARRPRPRAAVGALRLDLDRFTLRAVDLERVLTPTEFRLLAELLARPGEVVRRAELVDAGWVPGALVHGNTLDTYLHRIRRHLRELGSAARVETVRRVGYVLRPG